jgi:hypothetical protein
MSSDDQAGAISDTVEGIDGGMGVDIKYNHMCGLMIKAVSCWTR